MAPLIEVERLAVAFPRQEGWRRVVDGVTLAVEEGEVVGVVGESGCGKTLTGLALLGLVPEPGRVAAGRIRVAGVDVLAADEKVLCRVRGGTVGFVFQEPARALNPVRSIGFQVGEAARIHLRLAARAAWRRAVEVLREVGLEPAEALAAAYPHQLSGGQRQRALLACALAADPAILVADEPTSALDTVAQREVADLLAGLRRRRGLSVVVISHDLALVARLADVVTVLYAGETVEIAGRDALMADPLHPYAQALLQAQPGAAGEGDGFATIPGDVPRPAEWGSGCRFAARCPHAFARCSKARPALVRVRPGRRARCFLLADEEEPRGDS